MSATHTAEPWHATPNGGDDEDGRSLLVGVISDKTGEFEMIADCRSHGIEDAVGGDEEENARRIVACVNVLAGIHTETLEILAKLPKRTRLLALKGAVDAVICTTASRGEAR